MNYNKKTVKDIEVKGKKVLLRCDFNVPMAKDGSGVITDDKRIRAALPTIQYLLDQGAAVIACSHMGKPVATFESYKKKQLEKGKDEASITEEKWKKSLAELRMEPVAARLGELLGKEVILADDVVGPDAQAKAAALKPGEILLLQNTRFEKGETKNDPELAKKLASMAEIFVSDAFGTVHRAHATTAGVADHLPAVSGYLIAKELGIMDKKTGVPQVATLFVCGLSLVMLLFLIPLGMTQVAKLSNFGALSTYCLLNLCVIWYAFIRKKTKLPVLRSLVFPVLGALVTGAIFFSIDFDIALIGWGWVLIGVIYYLIQTRIFKHEIDFS